MKDRRVKDRRQVAKKMCKLCGKKLPEKEMFKKIRVSKNKTEYICCKICYEQFSGKINGEIPGLKYK